METTPDKLIALTPDQLGEEMNVWLQCKNNAELTNDTEGVAIFEEKMNETIVLWYDAAKHAGILTCQREVRDAA